MSSSSPYDNSTHVQPPELVPEFILRSWRFFILKTLVQRKFVLWVILRILIHKMVKELGSQAALFLLRYLQDKLVNKRVKLITICVYLWMLANTKKTHIKEDITEVWKYVSKFGLWIISFFSLIVASLVIVWATIMYIEMTMSQNLHLCRDWTLIFLLLLIYIKICFGKIRILKESDSVVGPCIIYEIFSVQEKHMWLELKYRSELLDYTDW